MLLEKLFLNLLIVLSPILIYTTFGDRWKRFNSPYAIGVLHGISSSLCLLFSYYALDLYWDLRYVPLVISTVYGGPAAGVINFAMILATRTYLGGNALFFGYVSITLSFVVLLWSAGKIRRLSGRRRVSGFLLVSVLPSVVMLFILITFTFMNQVEKPVNFQPITAVLFFVLVQLASAWLCATLQEFHIERAVMKEEIQRAEKMKTLGEVAASIAHEIRNPLTVVQGFLQLMKSSIDEGRNRTYLQHALKEVARAETIIHDYLNFSKPKLTHYETFSLTELLDNIILMLTPLASYRGVRLDSRIAEHIFLHTDRAQLQQAIVNVLKNAVEASVEKTVVQIKLTSDGNHARLQITDQGKGMTPEEVKRIGTLFYTTKENGTGLGTSVAIRIIEAMKGTLLYQSQKGKGTVCTITLPVE